MGFVDLFTRDEQPTMANFNKRLEAMDEIGNVHVWSKATVVEKWSFYLENEDSLELVGATGATVTATWRYSDSVNIDENGTISLSGGSSVTFSYNTYTEGNVLSGKYIQFVSGGSYGTANNGPQGVYFIPEGKTPGRISGSGGTVYLRIASKKCIPYIERERQNEQYVVSLDRNAYPDSGEYEGAEYEYRGPLGEKSKIQFASYVGTGACGPDYPNYLTFDFEPFIVISLFYVASTKAQINLISSNNPFMISSELTDEYATYKGFCGGSGNMNYAFGKKSNDGKTFHWYYSVPSAGNATYQLNIEDAKYFFVGVG